MLADLDKLPLPLLIAMGVSLAVIYAVRQFGIAAGERASPAKSQTSAQVAAVIVDSTALVKATEAVDRLTKAIDKHADVSEDHAHMICRRIEGLSEQLKEVTRAMVQLQMEMARRPNRP